MLVVVALCELHISYARSLKEKRMVIRSLRDRIRARFEIAVNEVAYHDLHQRARLALCCIASDHAAADSMLDSIATFVESSTDAIVAGWSAEILDFDEMVPLDPSGRGIGRGDSDE